MKVLTIAINTFREAVRNKVLYSVILFAIVIVCVSAFFGTVTIGDREKVIKDFGLFALSFFGAIITIICGVSLLSKELKQKTIYNILSKPVSRSQFIVGKHIGLTFTVCTLVTLMGAGLMLFISHFEGHVDWLLTQGIIFILFEMIVIAAVTIFFSALVVTPSLSGLFTLATFVAGRSIHYLHAFIIEEENANLVLTKTIWLLDVILPDLSLFNVSDSIVYGASVTQSHMLYAVFYCMGYSILALLFAAIIFKHRELT
jgi:ABC-type transport system involved in multi-copper enzyme maturation permease subunit